ncbi:MAG TPA: DNA topoisomerase IB [Candidatus Limnocylindria bacterium]|nr:DNA topoisomerase IB [Candidatus Limnocylindria bacterium]
MATVSAPVPSDATSIGLRYASPEDPGFRRQRAGKGFKYLDAKGRPITDLETLTRIRALAIPPAWTDVWICLSPTGHLQATGRDSRGRRQYLYHTRYRARRDATKFARLTAFGAALPRIRRQVRLDLSRRGLPQEKVLAAVVGLLDATPLRVGNEEYARVNKSFGISTLRDRHASVSGETIRFRFRGKGGRTEEATLVDRRLAAVVRRCRDLPGQRLFQYVDEDGEERGISSEDVNAYLREAAGDEDVSAKDFRTWTATVLAHRALRTPAPPDDAGRRSRPDVEAIRRTAEVLNDTLAVTRNSYVHPAVLAAFEPVIAGPPRPEPASTSTGRRGKALHEPIQRREELAVLAVLRRAARSAAAARRSQARGRRVAARTSRRAA